MKQINPQHVVIVAGSINMDIVVSTAKIPVPGETVPGGTLQYYPGGKGANQAIAARRSGTRTRMIGKVGSDAFGKELRQYLAAEGIDVDSVVTADGGSGVALIVVEESGENSIVVVPGANALVDGESLRDPDFSEVAVGLAQFEIPVPTIETFFEHCRALDIITVLNTAPAMAETGRTFELADVIVFNETELNYYAGKRLTEQSPVQQVLADARRVRASPEQLIVVTLGSKGAVALDGDEHIVIEGKKVVAVDTTGAGDCFVGYFSAAVARGLDVHAALQLAGEAAAYSVGRSGAGPSMPHLFELDYTG